MKIELEETYNPFNGNIWYHILIDGRSQCCSRDKETAERMFENAVNKIKEGNENTITVLKSEII